MHTTTHCSAMTPRPAASLITSYRISPHRISPHRISSHLIASHLISSHRISSHLIASHRISSHLIASHLIASYLPYFCSNNQSCVGWRYLLEGQRGAILSRQGHERRAHRLFGLPTELPRGQYVLAGIGGFCGVQQARHYPWKSPHHVATLGLVLYRHCESSV